MMMTPNTANAITVFVFDSQSMMRLKAYTMMPIPMAAANGNSSGLAMRLRTSAL